MAGEIRQAIPLDKLSKWVDENVPAIKTPLEVKQFGYGQSNPTYLLTASDGNKYVMRKKPPGKLLSRTAHQVDREYRIIHALRDTPVPVPQAMCLCEDENTVGTAFYIMSFLDGRIFEDPALPDVSPSDRHKMWHSAVTTLAKFHSVKPESVGLGDFGRRGGFYDRQLKTFKRLSEDQAKTRDVESGAEVGKIPHYDEVVGFFAQRNTQPKDRSTFVHGDYKIDNVVFHKTEPRVIGVLDWEMATIGHPLSDLVNLIAPFSTAESPFAQKAGRRNLAFLEGGAPGLPSKEECIRWYEETVSITEDDSSTRQGFRDQQDAQSVGYNHPVSSNVEKHNALSDEQAAQAVGYNHPTTTTDNTSGSHSFKIDRNELLWAEAFGIYRGAVIMQGIAARYAVRQASSTKAMEYGGAMRPQGEMAWQFVQEVKSKIANAANRRSKL